MTPRIVEWGLAGRPAAGETESGDAGVVHVGERRALAAAVDALGHGPHAAEAARTALDALDALREEISDVEVAAEHCHRALRRTRGAAVSLAAFDADSKVMTWLGVGNVEGRLLRAGGAPGDADSLLLRPGIVGEDLPYGPALTTHVRRGDLLVLATDGVASSFADDLGADGSCERIAADLLQQHARSADDALVLVVRYLGTA